MKERSPVIFWLLLAATLCLDAVAVTWMLLGGFGSNIFTFVLALTYAQLSTLCVWVVLLHVRVGALWLAPFGAGLLAALTMVTCRVVSDPNTSATMHDGILLLMGLLSLHAATTSMFLWAFKPTRLFTGYRRNSENSPWRFGTKHLLLLMTGVPILIVMLSNSREFHRAVLLVTLLTAGSAMLAVAISSLVQATWLSLHRFAAGLGVALAIGILGNWLMQFSASIPPFDFTSFYLTQTVFVWAWLEVLYPRNVNDDAVAGDNESIRSSM